MNAKSPQIGPFQLGIESKTDLSNKHVSPKFDASLLAIQGRSKIILTLSKAPWKPSKVKKEHHLKWDRDRTEALDDSSKSYADYFKFSAAYIYAIDRLKLGIGSKIPLTKLEKSQLAFMLNWDQFRFWLSSESYALSFKMGKKVGLKLFYSHKFWPEPSEDSLSISDYWPDFGLLFFANY